MTTNQKLISLVAPMYNEEDMAGIFFDEVAKSFSKSPHDYEIICINDGSSDNTYPLLVEAANNDPRIKVINLARNYGKEIALTAGLDYAEGDAVIPIDCDLQDPLEVVHQMIEKWESGYQVVLGKRIDRSSDSLVKRTTSMLFYRLIDRISEVRMPSNVGDFRLLDRQVVKAVRKFRERSRFMKGIFASLGFRETTVEYVRAPRAAGTTKWNYWKLYGLALEGIISFTSMPLKIWSYVGATVALGAFGYGIYLIIKTLILGIDTPGYASLMVVVLFMSGLILICLGVIGEYLSRIFVELKARPIYLVMDTIGLDDDSAG